MKLLMIVATLVAIAQTAATFKDCPKLTQIRYNDTNCTILYNGLDKSVANKTVMDVKTTACEAVNFTRDSRWMNASAYDAALNKTTPVTHVRYSCATDTMTVGVHIESACKTAGSKSAT